MLDDVTGLRAVIDSILTGGLLDVVDASIFSTMTSGNNFTTFTPESGEAVADGVARAAAQLAGVGARDIIVALNPATYLSTKLEKATDSGVYLGSPTTLASRVVAVPAVTAGKVLAFSPGSVQWGDREGISVTAGMVGNSFIENRIVLRCEARGATLIRDEAMIAYGDATTA